MLTRDATPLTSVVNHPLDGVRIGVADDPTGSTGCTVVSFDGRTRVVADPRGGAVCWTGPSRTVDALCLAGGSVYGLDAVIGVRAALRDRLTAAGRRASDWDALPVVSGAAVYDFIGRGDDVTPTPELGRSAYEAALAGVIPVGRIGAGRHTSVGDACGVELAEWGGQGAAVTRYGDHTVVVLTVVNAWGTVTTRDGVVIRGNRDPSTGLRHDLLPRLARNDTLPDPTGNTTLTVVLTDAPLTDRGLDLVARSAHGAMNRVIRPFHTPFDGDLLYAVSLAPPSVKDDRDSLRLAVLAGETACDAVQCAVAEDHEVSPS